MERLTKYSEINKDYITPHCDNFNCNGCCRDCDYEQVIINKLAEYENTGLEPKEVEQLKNELEELKKDAIVPKFKVGKTLFFITNIENQTIKSTKDWFYVLDNEGLFIETNNLPYNDCFYDYTFDRVFSTKQEAEEALRKLEEIKNGK